MVSYLCWFPIRRIGNYRFLICKKIVDKHDAMANDAFFSDTNQFTNKCMGLNPCITPYRCILLNLYKGPDEYPAPNRTSIQINRFNQFNIFTKLNVPDSYY